MTPTTASIALADESVSINGDGTVTALGTAATPETEVNITLAKMATMQQLFDDEDVDEEIPRFWALSPKDVRDLLQIAAYAPDTNTKCIQLLWVIFAEHVLACMCDVSGQFQ